MNEDFLCEDNYLQTGRSAVWRCAYLWANILDTQHRTVIDSGSEISCISEEAWQLIRSTGNEIDCLPVTNTNIYNVVGKKFTKVTKQIFCTIKINYVDFSQIFLVINGLNKNNLITI